MHLQNKQNNINIKQVLFSENSAVWFTHKLQICNNTQ